MFTQEIQGHTDSIWVAKFSCDGMYLATGGKDAVLKVWKAIEPHEAEGMHIYFQAHVTLVLEIFPVFHAEPTREYREHEHDILDIAWSPAVNQALFL